MYDSREVTLQGRSPGEQRDASLPLDLRNDTASADLDLKWSVGASAVRWYRVGRGASREARGGIAQQKWWWYRQVDVSESARIVMMVWTKAVSLLRSGDQNPLLGCRQGVLSHRSRASHGTGERRELRGERWDVRRDASCMAVFIIPCGRGAVTRLSPTLQPPYNDIKALQVYDDDGQSFGLVHRQPQAHLLWLLLLGRPRHWPPSAALHLALSDFFVLLSFIHTQLAPNPHSRYPGHNLSSTLRLKMKGRHEQAGKIVSNSNHPQAEVSDLDSLGHRPSLPSIRSMFPSGGCRREIFSPAVSCNYYILLRCLCSFYTECDRRRRWRTTGRLCAIVGRESFSWRGDGSYPNLDPCPYSSRCARATPLTIPLFLAPLLAAMNSHGGQQQPPSGYPVSACSGPCRMSQAESRTQSADCYDARTSSRATRPTNNSSSTTENTTHRCSSSSHSLSHSPSRMALLTAARRPRLPALTRDHTCHILIQVQLQLTIFLRTCPTKLHQLPLLPA